MIKNLLKTTAVLLLMMFVGSAWGQETVTYNFSDVGAVAGLNETRPGIALDQNIGFGSFKNSGTSNPGIFSGQLRLYQNATKGGSIKIYVSNGVTVSQVVVHASGTTGPAAFSVDGVGSTAISISGGAYTMSGLSATSEVEFWCTGTSSGTRIYVDDFEVTYASSGATEPTNHATDFTATANSSSSIITTWTDADAGTQAPSGYLILANITGTFSDPVDGVAQADDTSLGDGTGVYNAATSLGTYTWTGLDAATTYYFKIYSYNGTSTSINYKTDSDPVAVPTANAITNGLYDNDSEVDGPVLGSQPDPTIISSTADTDGEAVRVFDMDIYDFGTLDVLATKISQLTIKAGSNNDADWSNEIQGVKLSTDGGSTFVTIGSPTIDASSIVIPVESGNLDVPNGDVATVSLYIYLASSGVTDNAIFEFMVDKDDPGFLADASGSTFASTFSNNTISNQIILDVDATQFTYLQQPSNVSADAVMSPSVQVAFTDENGNVDEDENGTGATITMTTTGTFSGSATTAVDATSGLATFNNLVFSAAGSGITITAVDTDGGEISSLESSGFDVVDLPNLIISEVADPADHYQGRYIELYNNGDSEIDFSTTTVYLCRQANGGSWYDLQLTGSIGSKETFLIATYIDFETTYFHFAPEITNASFNGNGNDGVFIFFNGDHTTGLLTDIFGVIDEDGSGKPWEYTDSKAVRNSIVTTPNATWTASEWTITAADVADCTPGEHNGYTSWKGGTGDWSTTTSWSSGVLPTSASNVIVPGGTTLTVDATDAAVNNINIQDGGAVTIDPDKTLSVSGIFTIAEGGSFINKGTLNSGVKGDAAGIMQLSIPEYTTGANGWHLLSSPVSTFDINGSDFDPGDNDDLYGWDENTYTWMNHKVGNPSQMTPGTGYLVAYETTATKDFSGTFNNADITFQNLSVTSNTGDPDKDGWHLLGNPYQSALQWTSTDWVRTNIGAGAKIMTSGGTYTDIAVGGTDIIPANQGFFVQATDATNTFTIPASQRVHDATGFYKSAIPNMLTLKASDGEFYVETWIQMMEGATEDFDQEFDVNFLGGMYQAPYLFSEITDNQHLSTNRIAPATQHTTVQLGFKSFLDREFTISTENAGSFGDEMEVMLEDTYENVKIDLKETPHYTFMASANELTNRFVVHFFNVTGIPETTQLDGVSIYAHNNNIYIRSELNTPALVTVYNMLGQEVYQSSMELNGLQSFNMPANTGWYVVQVVAGKGVKTNKVFIK